LSLSSGDVLMLDEYWCKALRIIDKVLEDGNIEKARKMIKEEIWMSEKK